MSRRRPKSEIKSNSISTGEQEKGKKGSWTAQTNARKLLKSASQPPPPHIFYATEEIDGDAVKKIKLKAAEYGLIAPISKDGNDLVDKHFSEAYHIKSIYIDDEEEYMESFYYSQYERYDKIIENLNDTEESMLRT